MSGSILTPDQALLLSILSKEKTITSSFYLSGGTALAEFYLHHRLSEDLDFFSEEEVDAAGISALIKKMSPSAGIIEVTFEQSFNRNLFFVHMADSLVKTEFTYYPFPRIEPGLMHGALAVDSLLDIAVNKVFTISQKPRSRDFIELYCILQKQKDWTFDDLILKAQAKFDHHIDPLQMSAQCLKATELKDFPTMIIPLGEERWQDFFIKISKRLAQSQLT
ncbi:MAG: nucleotidyl transferase AbiEii/AbiGii toxin family protein [Patescibacteria group bacterium]